ncbi:MAG: hypothetical protein KC912_10965 [Proteobacteria bacterium]|nr:hypothetical protein [Pseudomonadota bacterium]
MRSGFALIVFLFMSLGLAGCGTQAGCSDNGDCGDLEVCVRANPSRPGVCADVDCVTSEHCDLGSYCAAPNYECTPGCDGDSDCRAGQTCNAATHACEAYGCRDTDLDCNYGEFCVDGTCIADTAPHCEPGCSSDAECGAGGQCLGWSSNGQSCIGFPGECGAGADCYCTDESCTVTECFDNRCLVGCAVATDCPRGYDCRPDLGNVCLGDCDYLDQWN